MHHSVHQFLSLFHLTCQSSGLLPMHLPISRSIHQPPCLSIYEPEPLVAAPRPFSSRSFLCDSNPTLIFFLLFYFPFFPRTSESKFLSGCNKSWSNKRRAREEVVSLYNIEFVEIYLFILCAQMHLFVYYKIKVLYKCIFRHTWLNDDNDDKLYANFRI